MDFYLSNTLITGKFYMKRHGNKSDRSEDAKKINRDNEKLKEEHPNKVIQSAGLYPEILNLTTTIKVLDTYKNLEWLLKHFYADIKYNLMTRKREIIIPGHFIFTHDEQNSALLRVKHLATLNFMPTKSINEHLQLIASENSYHPIVEGLKQNKWDGIRRLDDFVKTIKTDNDEFTKQIITTWMIAAIAAAHTTTGFSNQGVLVLQGTQGVGKTEWVKALDPFNCNAVKEGALLEPKNKDSIISLSRFWIIELGELDATFNTSHMGMLKSFITSHVDDIRFPYAQCDTRLFRQTAYIATVNDENFLVDDTGNRRWWTLCCKEINYQHGMDMKQVWAEVYDLWRNGKKPYLDKNIQSQVNNLNVKHEKVDPLKEQILSNYHWDNGAHRELSASQILRELGYYKPTSSETRRVGKIMKSINVQDGRLRDGVTIHKIPSFKVG